MVIHILVWDMDIIVAVLTGMLDPNLLPLVLISMYVMIIHRSLAAIHI